MSLAYLYAAKEVFLGTLAGMGVYQRALPKSALDPCPLGSINCIRSTWTPPEKAASKEKSIRAVAKILDKYPQEGQNGIDMNGWKVVGSPLRETGETHIEFYSTVGKVAKAMNGGKPFVDDFLVLVEDDGRVQVRSSSRVGYGDMGVNKKRVQYMIDLLPKGWDAPSAEYN